MKNYNIEPNIRYLRNALIIAVSFMTAILLIFNFSIPNTLSDKLIISGILEGATIVAVFIGWLLAKAIKWFRKK